MSTLDIYMKSGNVITIKRIKNWSIRNTGNEVTGFCIELQKNWFLDSGKRGLIMNSVDLSQIEAVIER